MLGSSSLTLVVVPTGVSNLSSTQDSWDRKEMAGLELCVAYGVCMCVWVFACIRALSPVSCISVSCSHDMLQSFAVDKLRVAPMLERGLCALV